MPRLVIREAGTTHTFRIGGEVVSIGRAATSDIQILDAKSSREHCTLNRVEDTWRLVDLQSQNGTFVNGERITERVMQYGDRIQIGAAEISFESDPSDAPADGTAPERTPSGGALPAVTLGASRTGEAPRLPRRRRLRHGTLRRRVVWPSAAPSLVPASSDPAAPSVANPESDLRRLLDGVDAQSGVAGLNAAADLVDEYLANRTGASRYEDLVELKDNLLRLTAITTALNSEHNLRRLLDAIMDAVIEITSAERGFLILLEAGRMDFKVARNFDKEAVKKPEFKISHSIAETVIKSGRPLITADAQTDEKFSAYVSVSDLKLRSVLCLPFAVKERVLGCLYIDNRFETGLFTDADLSLLTAFASQAAVAIENARLIEENLRKQEELQKSKEQIEALNRRLEEKVRSQSAELVEVREVLRHSQSQLETKYNYKNIIARSPRMQEVFRLLDRVTDSNVPVLIEGESGTGKELVARAIHFNGPRLKGHFVSENCGAIPESLLESELFGYMKGAFTGAGEDRKGLFELASDGTLFLDEISDMPLEMQKKLLRALQEGEIRRVGGKENLPVNVRIISASNKDLQDLIRQGKFREDLYYRINVVKIKLPPLRERREDIPLLVDHFLGQFAREAGKPQSQEVDRDALRLLMAYAWPGNIRELENEIYRAATLSEGPITCAALREELQGLMPSGPLAGSGREGHLKDLVHLAVEQVERDVILKTLQKTGWTKTETSRLLGISRPTLDAKIEQYRLQREEKKEG
ncbi:MAG: sigma 54-interacting transcriptional regulator [Planctomycetes bacterium]|nr:sigma 54-interacting transcriptional regulator [Planctomycetota bacterium]